MGSKRIKSMQKQAMHVPHIPRNTCGCGELQAKDLVGPFLRFCTYVPELENTVTGEIVPPMWFGSVLLVSNAPTPPGVKIFASTADESIRRQPIPTVPNKIYKYQSWTAFRYSVNVPLQVTAQRVAYSVEGIEKEFEFHIPGKADPWHWGFYSCNGFTNDVSEEDVEAYGGISPLWEDVARQHAAAPLHVMVAGGDQLYNDDVFTVPSLQAWFESGRELMEGAEFTEQMRVEVDCYYFHHYATHFSHPAVHAVYSSVAQVMTWDDHDIFDGWGSYPEELQMCKVFRGIFVSALHYYLLFQQHTNMERAEEDGLITAGLGYCQLAMVGPSIALLIPDQRADRTRDQVVAIQAYADLFLRAHQLPSTVAHIILVTTIPLVYPEIIFAESMMGCFSFAANHSLLGKVLEKMGVSRAALSQFNEPELLDDLRDHWNSEDHLDERRFMIEHMQMLAKSNGIRVSIISGDVHLAALGELRSKVRKGYRYAHMKRNVDFRWMPQIVSSAISNAPPPSKLVKILHLLSLFQTSINRATYSNMRTLFPLGRKMWNRRNWTEVWENWEVTPKFTRGIKHGMIASLLPQYTKPAPKKGENNQPCLQVHVRMEKYNPSRNKQTTYPGPEKAPVLPFQVIIPPLVVTKAKRKMGSELLHSITRNKGLAPSRSAGLAPARSALLEAHSCPHPLAQPNRKERKSGMNLGTSHMGNEARVTEGIEVILEARDSLADVWTAYTHAVSEIRPDVVPESEPVIDTGADSSAQGTRLTDLVERSEVAKCPTDAHQHSDGKVALVEGLPEAASMPEVEASTMHAPNGTLTLEESPAGPVAGIAPLADLPRLDANPTGRTPNGAPTPLVNPAGLAEDIAPGADSLVLQGPTTPNGSPLPHKGSVGVVLNAV